MQKEYVQKLNSAKEMIFVCHVKIKSIETDKTVCECNHLTNFALIFDISNSLEGMSQTETDILRYILDISTFCNLLL